VSNATDILGVVNRIREANISIYVLALGKNPDVEHYASEIASYPYYFRVDRYFRLTQIWREFSNTLCARE